MKISNPSTPGASADDPARASSWRSLLALGVSGVARAQGPAYSASPPTKGAWYSDGQTGRYLLGGTWLYRPDTSDVGVAQGWWRNVAVDRRLVDDHRSQRLQRRATSRRPA